MRAKGGWKNPNQFHFFFLSSIGARRKGDGQKKNRQKHKRMLEFEDGSVGKVGYNYVYTRIGKPG